MYQEEEPDRQEEVSDTKRKLLSAYDRQSDSRKAFPVIEDFLLFIIQLLINTSTQ